MWSITNVVTLIELFSNVLTIIIDNMAALRTVKVNAGLINVYVLNKRRILIDLVNTVLFVLMHNV